MFSLALYVWFIPTWNLKSQQSSEQNCHIRWDCKEIIRTSSKQKKLMIRIKSADCWFPKATYIFQSVWTVWDKPKKLGTQSWPNTDQPWTGCLRALTQEIKAKNYSLIIVTNQSDSYALLKAGYLNMSPFLHISLLSKLHTPQLLQSLPPAPQPSSLYCSNPGLCWTAHVFSEWLVKPLPVNTMGPFGRMFSNAFYEACLYNTL